MRNPILIELTRGALVESVHGGAFAVVDADGRVAAAAGDIATPVFPRSAVKSLQAIPFVESGALARFGFGAPEVALAAASHSGTPRHAALAQSMLARAGVTAEALACGAHEPLDARAARELVKSGTAASALNHNCSGKHAGMLATAAHMAEPIEDYWRVEHPVQRRIAGALAELTGCAISDAVCGTDGCSVPNWAVPLAGLARGFARFATGAGLGEERRRACTRIAAACAAHPQLVAGSGRLDTLVLQHFPGKVLIKSGAEGVYCGALPEHGLGFAIKIDDGAKRGAEAVAVALIARFAPEVADLGPPAAITNWRGLEVGRVRPSHSLLQALRPLGSGPSGS